MCTVFSSMSGLTRLDVIIKEMIFQDRFYQYICLKKFPSNIHHIFNKMSFNMLKRRDFVMNKI